KTDELPDWTRDGKLGVDVLFDNNSYNEMYNALKQAADIFNSSEKKANSELIKVLTGQVKPSFSSDHSHQPIPELNSTQEIAVNRILSAQELAIVHGPPGTRKTTTLIQAIKALIKQNHNQVLVVAPSNTAVDL